MNMKLIPNRAISIAIAIILFFGYNTSILKADKNEDLIKAVETENLTLIKSLIEKGANVNTKNEYGLTALHIAVVKGNLQIIKYLVEKGADVKAKNEDDKTVLNYAKDRNNLEIVKYLIEKGADVNGKTPPTQKPGRVDIEAETAAREARKRKLVDDWFSKENQERLARQQDNIYDENPKKVTDVNAKQLPSLNEDLFKAVETENLTLVKSLVSKGANINAKYDNGWTVLHSAAKSGNFELVKFIVNNGADVNSKTEYGETILYPAAKSGNLEIVKYLVEKGADAEAKTEGGRTVLHDAAEGGVLEIVEYLVEKGVNVNSVNIGNVGNTTLHNAARGGNLEIVKYLVSKGANINAKQFGGSSVLDYAAEGGNFEIFKYLIEKGTDIRAKDNAGGTVLHNAARGGNFEIVKYLVSKGADVKAKTDNGYTVLHDAAQGGFIKIESIIKGVTNIRYEPQGGNLEIVKYLVGKGADVKAKTGDGWTVLDAAIRGGKFETVKYLVDKGADRASLIDHKRSQWWYCDGYNTNCIYKMKLTFENKSYKPVKSITFMLTITDPNKSTLYKKKHTVALDLDNDEVGDTQEFKLNGNVNSSYGFDDSSNHSINVEVISVK